MKKKKIKKNQQPQKNTQEGQIYYGLMYLCTTNTQKSPNV